MYGDSLLPDCRRSVLTAPDVSLSSFVPVGASDSGYLRCYECVDMA